VLALLFSSAASKPEATRRLLWPGDAILILLFLLLFFQGLETPTAVFVTVS
jgi:hypothetical protein